MDAVLSDKLSQFFDQMLGHSESVESQSPEANSKRKSKKKKNKNKYEEETKEEKALEGEINQKQDPKISKQKNAKGEKKKEVVTKANKSIKVKPDIDTKSKLTEDSPSKVETSPDKSERFTKDGFKIVSLIPNDDSDVSDAFEYDSEEEDSFNCMDESEIKNQAMNSKPKKGPAKMTEDGFKIVNDIPADDSDVSDAFEEDEGLGSEQEPGLDNHYKGSLKNVKKPILQMINDFGIDGDILLGKTKTSGDTMNHLPFKHKSKGSSPNSLTLAAKKRKQSEITVLDYTKKRGSDKKKQKTDSEPEEENAELPSQPENTMDEKLMKRVRYDVFKLGMSGFNKKEKEDARIALAIKLGAKPPKNKAISYKELVEKKKEEKKKFDEEQEERKEQGLKVTKMKSKKPERREVVKPSTAQIGRFKNGIQMLSKKDIAKIKRS
ncbi:hypothetical protein Pcinc_007035 [Petrolisthes cinctipes]|uniref:Uncharacterized protein n=1 Tax=Petrolisthes cinctipes TaxID=88211 RepID=A0AAE1GBY6_PETCI|nr:hypothetical protein Pcinc_007035 [Petrolisthes cinctipes]